VQVSASDTIAGSTSAVLTLTPGFVSEAVKGTESMLKEPNGCFEQTTSSAWPNTLVTNYLRDTGQLTPELEARAFDLVTRGYQRLLTFESPTGGVNWWGDNHPGNRILSAIMLWYLKDLEPIIEIDLAVRDRTLTWLFAQQNGDGSFEAGDALHAGNEVLGENKVRSTAFIAWALAHTGWAPAAVDSAAAWLRANPPPDSDLYSIALAANALAKIDPSGSATDTLLARLSALKVQRPEGGILWPTSAPSWTGASGDVAAIETTGLVAYGLMNARAYPDDAAGAMRFIIANKDSVGTWYNTQATMNALRALSAAASPQGSDAEGTLVISVNGTVVDTVVVTQQDGDVYRAIDLTPFVGVGDQTIGLDMVGVGELSYQLSRKIHRYATAAASGALALGVSYDRTTLGVGDSVAASVVATNNGVGARDQVIVRVGMPPGFVPRSDDLQALVAGRRVARYEVNADNVTMYLMGLQAGEARQLPLRFVATLAIVGAAPASRIYAYYEPTLRAEVASQVFAVAP